jgi:Flp pilus assembly protein TadG
MKQRPSISVQWPSLLKALRDNRGASAVEFALIVPVMITLYFGDFEITQALSANRLVALTAGTVTNLVTQYTTISASSQMPDILNASTQVMSPYAAADTTVVVSSIAIDASGKATVAWSQSLNGSPRAVGQVVNLPAALDMPNSSIILGETSYLYTPQINIINLQPMRLYSSVYMLPRASPNVTLVS